jgi:hypothetical protein
MSICNGLTLECDVHKNKNKCEDTTMHIRDYAQRCDLGAHECVQDAWESEIAYF